MKSRLLVVCVSLFGATGILCARPAAAQDPNKPVVTSITLDKTELVAGAQSPLDRATGTVTISFAYPQQISVFVDSDNEPYASPSSITNVSGLNITFPPNATTANFTLYSR